MSLRPPPVTRVTTLPPPLSSRRPTPALVAAVYTHRPRPTPSITNPTSPWHHDLCKIFRPATVRTSHLRRLHGFPVPSPKQRQLRRAGVATPPPQQRHGLPATAAPCALSPSRSCRPTRTLAEPHPCNRTVRRQSNCPLNLCTRQLLEIDFPTSTIVSIGQQLMTGGEVLF